jgi:hypothetical protein
MDERVALGFGCMCGGNVNSEQEEPQRFLFLFSDETRDASNEMSNGGRSESVVGRRLVHSSGRMGRFSLWC